MLAEAVGGQVVTADRRLDNGVYGGPLDQLVLEVTDPPLPLSEKLSAAPIRKRSESSYGVSLEGL